MRSLSRPAGKLSAKELCLLALMGALMFALQVAISALPNIHLTALIIILAAVFFSWRALYAVAVFIVLEGLIYGFGIWWLNYLYAWPVLTVAAVLLRKNNSAIVWAAIAAAHGFMFGALCSIPYYFMGGAEMGISYWISGIPFDLLHGVGNFIIVLLLYKPLHKVMNRIKA